MQGLHQYERFAHKEFFEDKQLTVTNLTEWKDYQTKQHLGWKVAYAITVDNTPYRPKANGDIITNLYQVVTFKTAQKPDVKPGDIVVPTGDVICTVFGDFRNQLSIKCDSMQVVTPKGKD